MVFAFDRAGITGPDGPSAHGVLDLALALCGCRDASEVTRDLLGEAAS